MGPSLAGKPIPRITWDVERDAKIAARVKELLENNAEVKAVAVKSPYLAWRKALAIATSEIPPKGGGFGGGQADVARSQGDAKLSRDERLQALALTLLKTDPDLVELAKRDSYGAFKLATRTANTKLKGFEVEWARRGEKTGSLAAPGRLVYLSNSYGLSQFDAPVLSDGTLWSHAATMGTRIKGTAFTIDKAVIENCIRVFKSGYPQKISIDYEHGTVNGAADRGQPVPAAGQVKELRGIYSVADFTGDIRAAAEKVAAKVGRSLDDSRNFGLWMRWHPTAKALQMVTAREYTELSIAFLHDLPHIVTGASQGPVIVSIALTNTPFLDDMLPIAATA